MKFRMIALALVIVLFTTAPALADVMIKPVGPAPYDAYYDFANKFDDQAHTLKIDDFVSRLSEKNVVVADLRSRAEYDASHIKGAVYLGPDITDEKLAAIAPSKDTMLLVYCTNSLMLTRRISLTNITMPQIAYLGYKNVFRLEDAKPTGSLEGKLPMEQGAGQ